MREDPTPEVGFGLSTLVARRFDRVSRQRDRRLAAREPLEQGCGVWFLPDCAGASV